MNKFAVVRVPATTANLGGGFDCLGMALSLYHTVKARIVDTFTIESDADVPLDRSNLIYIAMNEVFSRVGKKDVPVQIISRSDIPKESGLGSSAACIVAGVLAADALTGGLLSEQEKIDICTSLDGHPDNVVPALVGGATACCIDRGHTVYVKCNPKIFAAVATPDFSLSTKKARAALPDMYSRVDCVYSLSRAAVTFGALASSDYDKLKVADDKLHQPYRIPLIKGYDKVKAALESAGAISVTVSGAGPSVVGLFKEKPAADLPEGWTLRVLSPDCIGASIKWENV